MYPTQQEKSRRRIDAVASTAKAKCQEILEILPEGAELSPESLALVCGGLSDCLAEGGRAGLETLLEGGDAKAPAIPFSQAA